MNETQSNTRRGPFPIAANADLTSKEGYLAKIVNSSGVAKAALPAAAGDHTPFLITDGVASGENATLEPIIAEKNFRMRLNGTCVPGDEIVREDETGADTGKVRKLPAGAGTYTRVGIAEETGADEGLVAIRPHRFGEKVTVV